MNRPERSGVSAPRFAAQQAGIALIFVLITMTVLITLAANFVLTVSRDTESIDWLNARVQARYSALSGIQYALFAMQDRDKEQRWTTDGQIYSVTLVGGEVYARIMPESGRIDINLARPEILTQLFQYAGMEEADAINLMNNVMHWRTGNDVIIGNSVSDADYESAGFKPPAHRNFYTIEELSQVYGVTPSVYQRIKTLITVYGSNRINGLVASDAVLSVLQLTDEEIAQVHAARDAYYADETPIPQTVRALSQLLTFTPNDGYFRVMAYAQTANGQTEAVYSIYKNQRNRQGGFREMQRDIVSGSERQALIDAVKQAQTTNEE